MRLSGAEVAVAHLLLDYGNDLAALTPSALKVRSLHAMRMRQHTSGSDSFPCHGPFTSLTGPRASFVDPLTLRLRQAVTARYDVEYGEHLRIMTTMYTEFLLAMLQWPEVRMHEPTQLVELSAALGLDPSTIGDAHCLAAEEVSD